MKKHSFSWLLILIMTFGLMVSCKSKSAYPCPNTKKSSKRSAKLSKSEDGGANPATGGRGKSSKGNNGLIKRKEPKRIHKRK